jgi:hypothetical protein
MSSALRSMHVTSMHVTLPADVNRIDETIAVRGRRVRAR